MVVCIDAVVRSDMVVRSIGNSLMVILPDLVGKKITNWFDLVRPLIAFKFQSVRYGSTNYKLKQILSRDFNLFMLFLKQVLKDFIFKPRNGKTKP